VGACDSYELLGVKDEFIGGELFDVSWGNDFGICHWWTMSHILCCKICRTLWWRCWLLSILEALDLHSWKSENIKVNSCCISRYINIIFKSPIEITKILTILKPNMETRWAQINNTKARVNLFKRYIIISFSNLITRYFDPLLRIHNYIHLKDYSIKLNILRRHSYIYEDYSIHNLSLIGPSHHISNN
jgi:hypothetical protein